jgi:HAE1 family hydrophobic/amphiphilic exporter-1
MKVPGLITSFLVLLTAVSFGAQETVAGEEDYQMPESYVERMKAEGAILELSLADAIRLALTNNLEIEIENYNEDLNRERVFGTRGFYDPVLSFSLGWNSLERANTRTLDAGLNVATTIFKNWNIAAALEQNFKTGGALSLNFGNNRFTTNDNFTFINPQYSSSFDIRFTQPLLRGFRQTQTERQIKLFNLDVDISDSQFKQRVSDIISQVESQYWELVYAIENYETLRRSLELAIVQYRNNRKRVDIGVMAPIEITSSRAEVAAREQDMITSRVQIISAQNALKGYVAPDPRDNLWSLTLIPTGRPSAENITITLDQAIQTALEKRPELEQIRFQLDKNEIDRAYYKKDGKWAVDLQLGLVSRGTAGQVFGREINGEFVPGGDQPAPDHPLFGNFSNAWSQTFQWDFPDFIAGVNVEVPLRNRANEANLASVALTERQLLSQTKNTQQLITVEVRNAYESIAVQKEAMEAAILARELAEEQLRGENKRFEAGLSTNFEVLRYQRDLASSQVRELRAIIDYQLALTSLKRATFTLVVDNDFVVARR